MDGLTKTATSLMNRNEASQLDESSLTEVTSHEISLVSGAADSSTQVAVGAAAGGAAVGIGSAAFGASWGSVGVGLAFAVSPLAVVAIVGLTAVAGYSIASAALSA